MQMQVIYLTEVELMVCLALNEVPLDSYVDKIPMVLNLLLNSMTAHGETGYTAFCSFVHIMISLMESGVRKDPGSVKFE